MGTANSKKLAKSLAAALVALAATAAGAQTAGNAQGLLDNRFVFSAGAFLLGTDVNAALNGASTRNPDVDFDETFGKASDSTRARVDALWRINPKHHLRFLYFNDRNTRSRTLDRTINWGDATYNVGSNVESEVKMEVVELAYEYAFLRAPTYEIAGTFGVHYTDLSLRLSGTATVNGVVRPFETRTSSLPAPLPVIGVRGGWVVAPNWYLDASAQVFKLSVDGYDGNWADLRAGATWMFSRNFGVGLGYSHFSAKVDVDRANFNGRLKLAYGGLQAYLTGTF
jgi:hypothetical protein